MRLLAKIGIARDVLDDAEMLLEAVLALGARTTGPPASTTPRCSSSGRSIRQARAEVERLLALDPANLDYRALAATVAVGLGEHEARDRDLPRHAGRRAGRARRPPLAGPRAEDGRAHVPEAIDAYRAAAAARPDFGDAYWSLANLKTYRFADDGDRAHARRRRPRRPPRPDDRDHLCFALGKALEDRGEIAESWAYYERGNALQARGKPLSPRDHRDQHRRADRGLHPRVLRAPRRLGRRQRPTRSSSSACRGRARP